ncbi:MAG: GNAT family N-acetyltransferase [Chitinophagales bacterium]
MLSTKLIKRMEIQQQQTNENGEFFILDEQQEKLAYMTYIMDDALTMRIEHTVVTDKLAGQGIGKKLVQAGVLFARANHYKIVPECPYALAVFQKTPEYAEVWKQK